MRPLITALIASTALGVAAGAAQAAPAPDKTWIHCTYTGGAADAPAPDPAGITYAFNDATQTFYAYAPADQVLNRFANATVDPDRLMFPLGDGGAVVIDRRLMTISTLMLWYGNYQTIMHGTCHRIDPQPERAAQF